jgi:hypothetical protein
MLGFFLDDQSTISVLVKDVIDALAEQVIAMDQALVRLALAGLAGWLINCIYRRTFTGRRYNPSLGDTHVLLTLVVALVWVVVQNNVVKALGLAAAVRVFRYRSIVRDPKDASLLLGCICMGSACGLGLYLVAALGIGILAFALLWLQIHDARNRAAEVAKGRSLLALIEETKSEDADDNAGGPGSKG